MAAIRRWQLDIGSIILIGGSYLANLAHLLLKGRLASAPRYDDVVYLLDAFTRTIDDRGHGLSGIASSFLANPPHAPLSTITGVIGFSFLGPSLLSAYAANIWILALFVAVALRLSSPIERALDRTMLVAIALFLPLAHSMITEFRPDLAAGLLFGMALFAICATDILAASAARLTGIGLLLCAAVVAKPSAAVVVIPIGVGAVVLATIVQSADIGLLAVARRSALMLAAFVLAMIPVAVIWGTSTVPYIYQALISNSDIWHTDPDPMFNWLYHSIGEGGATAFGTLLWPAIAICLWDATSLLIGWRNREARRALTLYAVLVVLYGAMATSAEKTVFQGSMFYLPLAIAFLAASARRLSWLQRSIGILQVRGLLVAGVVALALTSPIASSYSDVREHFQTSSDLSALADELTKIVISRKALGCPRLSIVTLNPQPVNPQSIALEMLMRGYTVDFWAAHFIRTPADAIVSALKADVAILPTIGDQTLDTRMPSFKYLAQIEGALAQSTDRNSIVLQRPDHAPITLSVKTGC